MEEKQEGDKWLTRAEPSFTSLTFAMATIGGAGAPPPPPPGGDKNTPGGHNNGFLKPTRGKKREQKMKWKEGDNDRKLLLIGLGREVAPREYPVIAASYPGTIGPISH